MNVWVDLGKGPRPRGHKPNNTAKAPRTREGQAFPGGKHMRRALKRLSVRQNTFVPTIKANGQSCTKPGSMRID